jgi:hypothetical protein
MDQARPTVARSSVVAGAVGAFIALAVPSSTPPAAAVGPPRSTLTWALWRYEWPFEPGEHTFVVRAVDGFGDPQVERAQSPEPDGATGI